MKRLDPALTRLSIRAKARKKPARKLLDVCLIALLGGVALPVFAQDAAPAAPPQTLTCGDAECTVDGKPVIKIISRGETESHEASADALQAQRRVDVEHQV